MEGTPEKLYLCFHILSSFKFDQKALKLHSESNRYTHVGNLTT